MLYTPTSGPSRRMPTTPGRDRSLREPSKTTTMSGPNRPWPCSRIAWCRALTIAPSSAIRAATVSASLPISAAQFCPSAGRQWGSHRAQSQEACPLASVSTQTWTSSGLCRAATWATSHRPTDRGTSSRPAIPATPRPARGMVTGASGISQNRRRRCSSWVGSVSSTSDGKSAVPTRRSR